jgi:hypothetical protein
MRRALDQLRDNSIDLDHIPRGSKAQNRRRQYFQYVRSRSQGENASQTKEDALREAIEKVKAESPGFEPEFDQSYFSIHELPEGLDIKTREDGKTISLVERECVPYHSVPAAYHADIMDSLIRWVKG